MTRGNSLLWRRLNSAGSVRSLSDRSVVKNDQGVRTMNPKNTQGAKVRRRRFAED
jgi:hypothetical protein